MTKEQTNSWEDELEKYVRENCSLHILGLLGQSPDDPITSKDFRYIVTLIEQIISERDKEIIQVVKNMGRLGNTQQEKDWNAMLSWVVGELEEKLQTLIK